MTTYQQNNPNKLIPPSSSTLLLQLQAAEAKFEGSREQAILRKEAREIELYVRGEVRAARGRYYRRLQLGSGA